MSYLCTHRPCQLAPINPGPLSGGSGANMVGGASGSVHCTDHVLPPRPLRVPSSLRRGDCGGSASCKLTARGVSMGSAECHSGGARERPGASPSYPGPRHRCTGSFRTVTARHRAKIEVQVQVAGPGPAAPWAGPAGPGRHRDTAARASSLPVPGPGLKVSDLGTKLKNW